MVQLAAVRKSVTAPQAAQLFVDNVFRNHGLPEAFVSDRDPRFVSHFWQHLFRLLGTRLDMSTADHPQTDGQTERVNRVLEDILRSVCAAEATKWSVLLPQVEFALNNAVHSSTGFTPFYVNGLRHPRTPLTLPPASSLGGGGRLMPTIQGALKAYERPSNGTCSRLSRLVKLSDSAFVTPWRSLKTHRRNKVIARGVRTHRCSSWETKSY
ncbi:hypothetical protein PF001_g29212 [Phytophthora fragariae]|uniref:Integrase catalytic domain-containing protein n=1 Tax=Phytophthora fragariae TaxID=53985 RepID=A0A6A4BDX4_9STRA|nr:hypothetical protein PF001_g29212 [Phytophthora fragariae]